MLAEDAPEWERWLGAAKCVSPQVNLQRLPLKLTGGAGQGGGGAISVEEMDEALRIHTDTPLFAPGSVIHTDSAKSYKRLGPMRWEHCKAPGHPLYSGELQTHHEQYGYTHTNVSHKRKPWQTTA